MNIFGPISYSNGHFRIAQPMQFVSYKTLSDFNDICLVMNTNDLSDVANYVPSIIVEVRKVEENWYLIANGKKKASLECIDTWGRAVNKIYHWDRPVKKWLFTLERDASIERVIELILTYTKSLLSKRDRINWTTINFKELELETFIESVKGKTKTQSTEAVVMIDDPILCNTLNENSRVQNFFKVNIDTESNIYHMKFGKKQIIQDEEVVPVTFTRLETKIENVKMYLAWLSNVHPMIGKLRLSELHDQHVLVAK